MIMPTRRDNQHASDISLKRLFTYLEKEEAAIPNNPSKNIWGILNLVSEDI